MAKVNPFAVAQQQLDQCAKILHLDPGIQAALRVPSRELHVSLPVRMDDGSVKVFQGFRVQYNDAKGPCKGGIRFHPDETIDTVRALAAWMTWKCSLLDLPLGGGKGGVICNPKEMSQGELERLCRLYIDQVGRIIGPEKDVPAPDVYTNPQMMAWMMDEYSKISGKNQFGVITGKPLAVGGSQGRGDATARGGLYTVREAAKELGINLSKATIAVQGYGNAGYYAACLAKTLFGSKVVAVSDSKGCLMCESGLDPEAVGKHKAKTSSVCNFSGADAISDKELLELDVDILFPSALENVITEENAPRIRAKIVGELANGPTTPEADEILDDKGVFVVPDILANAGGVTVSYFEWVQNLQEIIWSEEEVLERLTRILQRSFKEVLEISLAKKIPMRTAALVLGIGRVAEATKLRGIYP